MIPRTHLVLETAVSEGVSLGWNRAHKHVDNPGEEDIKRAIAESVLSQISEWFRFCDEED